MSLNSNSQQFSCISLLGKHCHAISYIHNTGQRLFPQLYQRSLPSPALMTSDPLPISGFAQY